MYQLLGFPGAPPPPPPMRAVEAALFEEGLLTAPPAAAGDAPSGGGGGEASSAEAAAAALPDWSKEQQGRQGHGAKLAAGGGAAALARRAQAAASRVVSLGSWSKMLAPGMRLGWAEACPETLERLRGCGVLQSGGARRAAARAAALARRPPPGARRLAGPMGGQGRSCAVTPRLLRRGRLPAYCAPRLPASRAAPTHPALARPRQYSHTRPASPLNLARAGCIAPLPAAVAHSALELGLLEDHLSGHVRPALAARCGALCEEIDRQLAPLGCSYHKPAGGYFVWLQLPEQVGARDCWVHCGRACRCRHECGDHVVCCSWLPRRVQKGRCGSASPCCARVVPQNTKHRARRPRRPQVDARRLLEFASARHGVRFAPGALSNGGPRDARLSFAFYSPEELRIAVTRLAAALREFMAQAQG